MPHKPVLLQEALAFLHLKPGAVVVDGTLGNGGHSREIMKVIGDQGRLIGLDRDPSAVERCRKCLIQTSVTLCCENFRNLGKVLQDLNLAAVDAVLLDIGVSSEQLEDAGRGFSFDAEGPLDMRMNPAAEVSARDLVNDLSENELERIFRDFGEERRARVFARAIVEVRKTRPMESTQDLVAAVESVLPAGFRKPKGQRPPWARRHPAMRVFQALRIVINDELGALREGLAAAWKALRPGGRLVVITFHSLEDRIVKQVFRGWEDAGEGVRLTKKPVVPAEAEIRDNPRSRSAKLRAAEKK